MVTTPRRMSFEDFARQLGQVFDDIAEDQRAVLIQRGGRLYRVEPAEAHDVTDLWANYDPEQARRAMQEAVGALTGVDTAQLKADIKAARGQDSKGRPAD